MKHPNNVEGVQLGIGKHIWDVAPSTTFLAQMNKIIQVAVFSRDQRAVLKRRSGLVRPPNILYHQYLPCEAQHHGLLFTCLHQQNIF